MRLRRKKNLIPRLERCGDIWIREPALKKGQWLTDHTAGTLHLEIGCGRGKFTVETAEARRDVLLVAIERERNAMVIAMERAMERELQNIRFIDGDARALAELFAPGEVARIYINFPDPWPGRRHEKRRLVSPGFLELYRGILTPGGEIHFKTDNRLLFDYAIKQFPGTGYTVEELTYDRHAAGPVGVMTNYEQKFYEAGIPINRCVARWDGAER